MSTSRPAKERRQPLLVDRFMRSTKSDNKIVAHDTFERVRHRLQSARKFIFDNQAVTRLGEVIRDIPELLFRESKFARAPFEVMWIEFPFQLLWETITGGEFRDDGDARVGYLIDHNEVYAVTGGTKENPYATPRLLPISYLLHTPWIGNERQEFADSINAKSTQLEALFWGHTINGLSFDDVLADDHPTAAIRNHHSCRVLPLQQHIKKKALGKVLYGANGELRDIIAILLLLNRPSLTEYVQDISHFRGFISGKMQSYFSHTVVTINLDPKPTLRMIGTLEGEAISRRRHKARGTWCNNYDAREYEKIGCVHEWRVDPQYIGLDDPDDPDHWVCSVCEGKRWWRDEHSKGDATKGFVVKEYNVHARTTEARRTGSPAMARLSCGSGIPPCTKTAVIFGRFAGGLCLEHALKLAKEHGTSEFHPEYRAVIERKLKRAT